MKKYFDLRFIVLLMFVGNGLLDITVPLQAQQLSSKQVTEAKRQLSSMSPEEIDQKIRSLGMTRAEAEKRAKENGIDLQSFLRGSSDNPAESGSPVLIQNSTVPQIIPEVSSPVTVIPTSAKHDIPTKDGLNYFGYDIFASTPSAFEPSSSGPVDPDYILGADDVLRVNVWGQVEQQLETVIDKEGRIFIPSVGPVVLSGSTLEEANKIVTRQMSRSIQGLTSSPKTVWLDITLAKVKPKRVFIMGEVANPGGYTVGSNSTIFNTLFAVGGPTVNGSLREVRLIRDNKTIAKVDLYLYLTGAEKNNDVRVQNNDIIFVPVRKNTISISGEIRRPGIYELLPGENLKRLTEFAGGTTPTSYLERVQIERIIPMKERKKLELEREFRDVNFRDIMLKNADVTLSDGDKVTVFPVLSEVRNFITITGAVNKPGRYQLMPKMKLLDLIIAADSLRPDVYSIRGELTRFDNKTLRRFSIPFSLTSVLQLDANSNMLLEPMDEVMIHDVGISQETFEFVEIYGSVKNPGQYMLTKNMTLTDVLMLAGGYTEDAWTYNAEIARMDHKNEKDTIAYIYFSALPNLRDTVSIKDFNYFSELRSTDYHLKQRDKIFIRSDPNFRIQQLVNISGAVNFPGNYALMKQNEYLSDLITRAGGPNNGAFLRGGRLIRKGQRVNVDFQLAVNSPRTGTDIILHENDSISVPKKPNSISVYGEVFNPSILGYIEGEKLWDYINRAGGLKDSADFVILYHPTGNAERFHTGIFGGNTVVMDGSQIYVSKVPEPPENRKELDLGSLIRDLFAVAASALTILVLSRQL